MVGSSQNLNCCNTFSNMFIKKCVFPFIHKFSPRIVTNRNNRPIFSYHSVQFRHSVVSDSLRPYELQLARPPCELNQFPASTQTHVHWLDDAIQPSHPLLSASPPALNLSHHHGFFHFFQWSGFFLCIRWPKY